MNRFSRLITIFVLAFALVVVAVPSSAMAASSPGAFVTKVNQARAAHGMRALRASSSLRRSSTRYSSWMLRRDYFGHLAAIRASHTFSRRGEVLARTGRRAPDVAQIVRQWLRSPAHRAVLLNRRYRFIGIGIGIGRLGSRRATLVTGHFGAR